MIHQTGLWAIRFLLIALAVTPLRAALDWGKLLLLRRMLGLTAGWPMRWRISPSTSSTKKGNLLVVGSEIVHRFYLTIGFAVLLRPYRASGVTSTDAAIHATWDAGGSGCTGLTYLLGVLALLHYFIQSKANVSEPVGFVAGLYVLAYAVAQLSR